MMMTPIFSHRFTAIGASSAVRLRVITLES